MRPDQLLLYGLILLMIVACKQEPPSGLAKSGYYTDSIYSEALGEYRGHNVYLPKGYRNSEQYPIIYATDGELSSESNSIKPVLDSLIENKLSKPFIYIESHSNANEVPGTQMQLEDGQLVSMQYRFFEFVESSNESGLPGTEDRFVNHMRYFKDEFIPQLEEKLGQNSQAEDRIFYGFSNGGAFGVNLLNKHPQLIGTYICYSTVGSNHEKFKWDKTPSYPKLFLQYGSEEDAGFKEESEALHTVYKNNNWPSDLQVYQGGHEEHLWDIEFAKTITQILAATN